MMRGMRWDFARPLSISDVQGTARRQNIERYRRHGIPAERLATVDVSNDFLFTQVRRKRHGVKLFVLGMVNLDKELIRITAAPDIGKCAVHHEAVIAHDVNTGRDRC